jgi:hypothetical protein
MLNRVCATLHVKSVVEPSNPILIRTEMIQDPQPDPAWSILQTRSISLPLRRRNEIDKLTVIAAVDAEIFAIDGEYLRSGM